MPYVPLVRHSRGTFSTQVAPNEAPVILRLW